MTTELPPRLAVDANGYVWRVWPDSWSMARINPDNSPIPEPVTFYVPADLLAAANAALADTEAALDEAQAAALTTLFERDEARAALAENYGS